MKRLLPVLLFVVSFSATAQKDSDSLYRECPVAILDTATGNDYFIAHQSATVKAYKSGGDIRVVIEQKNQFFSIFFNTRKLKSRGKYSISIGALARDEARAKYSFRSGESIAVIDVGSGVVETMYDKTTKLWRIKLTGLIANMGETRVSYFKAKADFYIP
jgi:hypothetical protein